jgi:hypothetical protein
MKGIFYGTDAAYLASGTDLDMKELAILRHLP